VAFPPSVPASRPKRESSTQVGPHKIFSGRVKMNLKLLKKVEELTFYILDLQAQINKLKK
jgi:hypothetical protein